MTPEENQALIAEWIKKHEAFQNSWKHKVFTWLFYLFMIITSPIWFFPLIILCAWDYHFNKD